MLQVETTDYPLRLTMILEKMVYTLGEPINITLKLTNIGDKNVEIWFRDKPGRAFDGLDVIIYKNDKPIWSLSSGLVSMVIWELRLSPGESIERTYTWKQITPDKESVSPGPYNIVGEVLRGGGLGEYGNHTSSILTTPPIKIVVVEQR